MGQDPSEIRTEIEETRGRLGETAEAIGYKSDVKSRAGDWVSDKKDAVTSHVSDAKDKVTGAMPDTEQAKSQAHRGMRIARENPIGLAVAGAAAGFLVGLATPSTRMEDERMGDAADRLKDAAKEAGQEAVERGKQVAQEATETVKETGKEHGQEFASNLQERASGPASESASQTS